MRRLAPARSMVSRAVMTSSDFIAMEDRYGAHNYHPIPVVIAKGEGAHVWDVEGKQYLDFLSSYSAVNQGHCHPRIVKALTEQASTLALTSRAFHNNKLALFEKYITTLFGYDKVLPMNSGVEAGETAVKLCRKWAYEVKGVPANEAVVLFANNNFWGRSIAAASSSSDPECYKNYGPFTPGFELIDYNSIDALRTKLESNPNIAAFYVEPIQGEAGVVVPDDGYLAEVAKLCKQHNVLFVADEIQSGLCRSGKMLATDYDNVKPDVLVLGKALSGGMYPVSAVLTRDEVMLTIKPGQHGSTYGGNPIAAAVAIEALKVLIDEDLAAESFRKGEVFRATARAMPFPWIKDVRGRGLLNAIEIDPAHKFSAWDLCVALKDKGILSKPTHDNIIRFAPPLVISDEDLGKGLEAIQSVFHDHR